MRVIEWSKRAVLGREQLAEYCWWRNIRSSVASPVQKATRPQFNKAGRVSGDRPSGPPGGPASRSSGDAGGDAKSPRRPPSPSEAEP